MRAEFGNTVVMPPFLGNPELLFAYDIDGVIKLIKHEGPKPTRYGMRVLNHFRKTIRPDLFCGEFGSIGTEDGERWYKTRSVVNPIMLSIKMINSYIRVIDEISLDYVNYLLKHRNEKNEVDICDSINRWTLESIASVTLDRRLNLFDENFKDPRAEELTKVI